MNARFQTASKELSWRNPRYASGRLVPVKARPARVMQIHTKSYQDYGAAGGLSSTVPVAGRTKVLQLLGEGLSTYDGELFGPAVAQLIAENPTPQPGSQSLSLGQGTWQVFYAPHIAQMSSVLGTKFQPIQYRLFGNALVSNVKYSNPLLGEGWLSAGGTMDRKYDDAVEVTFDRFWVDVGADGLRADLPPDASSSLLTADGIIGALGRAAFFPQLAVFPVLYLDKDLAVFKFTPLDSAIAVHRVAFCAFCRGLYNISDMRRDKLTHIHTHKCTHKASAGAHVRNAEGEREAMTSVGYGVNEEVGRQAAWLRTATL
ncbi:hypothetical protein VOLCADRAFT_89810 [Volvox carteri f. nagariensis]|uniref:Uncharacterized protein n=1 Tax=Volvox carteri f. nagariensis TaxID=3068 RepID=D8TSP9_VOLCA|nr:uncharacterized protein VOLCADRAFT_89810 [Volvox carteri f. nagariensis]EFJ49410.1 hypothetical protein VOLCADRAFT_89810 [Volvox carteri f. nagariensis]|eukprot:XP_002949391.1 hypothetical protein VOLCADRAFT_89810 [Volvox carteri f. nagariensis]